LAVDVAANRAAPIFLRTIALLQAQVVADLRGTFIRHNCFYFFRLTTEIRHTCHNRRGRQFSAGQRIGAPAMMAPSGRVWTSPRDGCHGSGVVFVAGPDGKRYGADPRALGLTPESVGAR